MEYIRPILNKAEADAVRTVLRAVVDGRLLVAHDERLISFALEALDNAQGVSPDEARAAGARASDPKTSKLAALQVAPRAKSQRARALAAYVVFGQMASFEAAQRGSLTGCYWKRISELLEGGWLEDTGITRVNPEGGAAQRVLAPTDKAREWVRARDVVIGTAGVAVGG